MMTGRAVYEAREARLQPVVLEAVARGMSYADVASFVSSEFSIDGFSEKHVKEMVDIELKDPRMARALALRSNKLALASIPTTTQLEEKLSAQMETLESLMRDVLSEYVLGKESRADDLRAYLREERVKMSEAQIKGLIALSRKLSLDRAIQNAATVQRELRGTMELFLKSRGVLASAPTVNVLTIEQSAAELLTKLCPDCQARVAGLSPSTAPLDVESRPADPEPHRLESSAVEPSAKLDPEPSPTVPEPQLSTAPAEPAVPLDPVKARQAQARADRRARQANGESRRRTTTNAEKVADRTETGDP